MTKKSLSFPRRRETIPNVARLNTSNLAQRMYQHQEGLVDGFTKKYDVHQLVYYEVHLDVYEAITREKRIKKWNRQWKINLIEENNPQWLNLANGLF